MDTHRNSTKSWQHPHRIWRRYGQLYLLLLIPIVYFVIFKYIPMAGNIIAFRQYKPGLSVFGTSWAGLKYFRMFLNDPTFWKVFQNTIVLSVLNLVIGFPFPIIFALLLNEIDSNLIKRFVQTTSYLPRFFSTVVVVSMINMVLSPSTGIVNKLLEALGHEAVYFLNEPGLFKGIYILSDLWQFMGWNAILYIAALTNIDPQLYEAASIDGAGRWQQTINITLPGIMPTVVITFILSVGYVLGIGFEKVLLLYSPSTYETADVIQTYVYRMGITGNSYSYATAIGLFQAVISLLLLFSVNAFAKRFTETSLW